MTSGKRTSWFQLMSNLALIVGVIMVVYELRQARDFAEAQILTDEMTRISDRLLAKMGDGPMGALAKSVRSPNELTDEDAIVLDAYYNLLTLNWTGAVLTREMIGLEASIGMEVAFRQQARLVFTSDPGRRWLAHWAEDSNLPNVAKYVTDEVNNYDGIVLEDRLNTILGKQ